MIGQLDALIEQLPILNKEKLIHLVKAFVVEENIVSKTSESALQKDVSFENVISFLTKEDPSLLYQLEKEFAASQLEGLENVFKGSQLPLLERFKATMKDRWGRIKKELR